MKRFNSIGELLSNWGSLQPADELHWNSVRDTVVVAYVGADNVDWNTIGEDITEDGWETLGHPTPKLREELEL